LTELQFGLISQAMPRAKRKCSGGFVYHVLNCVNGRLRIFRKDEDFTAFERILAEGEGLAE
jgi:putative transposase